MRNAGWRKEALGLLSGNGCLGTPEPFNTLNKGDFNRRNKNLSIFLRTEEKTLLGGVLPEGMANKAMALTVVRAVLILFFLSITK